MKKPTIYIDTNIVSSLHYQGTDINVSSRRMATRDWWESERRFFLIKGSSFTELELASGQYSGQRASVRFVRRLPYVPITRLVRNLADALLEAEIIPPGKTGDAMQLALAAGHNFDYLLTWNYAHLANSVTQFRAERLFAKWGVRSPLLVSPESIPQVRFNKTIQR